MEKGGHTFLLYCSEKNLLKIYLFYKMPLVISEKKSIIREYKKEA